MNISETKGESRENYEGDKLDRIFAAQKDLIKGYKPIAEKHYSKIFRMPVKFSDETFEGGEHNLHTKEGSFLIRDMLSACISEIDEAIQVNKNWKGWKATEVPTDVNHFREEIIDSLHFWIEACILAGITADDVYDLYFRKNEVNHFRQESKY